MAAASYVIFVNFRSTKCSLLNSVRTATRGWPDITTGLRHSREQWQKLHLLTHTLCVEWESFIELYETAGEKEEERGQSRCKCQLCVP